MITKIEVPNVDDHSVSPQSLDDLYEEFEEIASTFRKLADYCARKQRAMRCRLNGRIETAQHHERSCESLYRDLPSWAKW